MGSIRGPHNRNVHHRDAGSRRGESQIRSFSTAPVLRPDRLPRRVAYVAVSVAVLAACANGSGEPVSGAAPGGTVVAPGASPGPQIEASQPPGQGAAASTVLEQDQGSAEEEAARYDLSRAVGYSPEELAVIRQAWNSVFSECVRAAGFDVTVDVLPEPPEDPNRYLARQRFDDIDRISAEGYHWLFEGSTTGETPLVDESGDGPAADEVPGEVTTQCKTTANERLVPGGTPMVADAFVQEANVDIIDRVQSDPLFAQAEASWLACRAESGYDLPSYDDVTHILDFISSPEVSQAEVSMARTDSECRQSSGLAETRLRLRADAVAAWVDEHSSEIGEMDQIIATELEAAKAILGS